jgi:bifunctional non-homologous end joining protein LigD
LHDAGQYVPAELGCGRIAGLRFASGARHMSKRRTPGGFSPIPAYKPQLAKLVTDPPDGDDWLHEMKYDGYRIGCRIDGGVATLISRNGKEWTAAFPEICTAAQTLGTRRALLDGEVAILLGDGRTSFQQLQNAFSSGSRRGLVYFAFDLLHLEGETLLRRPLLQRKDELLRLVGKPRAHSRIRYSEHVIGQGARLFEEACRLHLEGIISKQCNGEYKSGRTSAWVKTKCVHRQEFVIAGFTDPEGARQGIGALLVGYYDERGHLVFAGKVGTGFTAESARDLRQRLGRIQQPACPFVPPPPGGLGKHAHWVKPSLVAEVVFSEWTDDSKIRHPSFQGLRRDKRAADVRREQPAAPTREPGGPHPRRISPAVASARINVAGVSLSHPDRLMFPAPALTKLDTARYFERIADWILPHLEGRPLTLVRCAEGLQGGCSYMKHSKVWAPPALRRVSIQEKTKVGEYLIADTLPALISLVQMDVLEIHTWNTRIDHVEQPDRIVFDVDPGPEVSWPRVVEAARLVRRMLRTVDLDSFAKTTGGRGLHVVVPLMPRADWRACLQFARALARAIERHDPARYTTAFAKTGREGKILIDYLRNNRTNTSVAAFSTRARDGAPVSVTVTWDDITPRLKPEAWTMVTTERRLASLRRDPWRDYWGCRQRLAASATAAFEGLR